MTMSEWEKISDRDGVYMQRWDGEPPPMGVRYRVRYETWEGEEGNLRRTIHLWDVVEDADA